MNATVNKFGPLIGRIFIALIFLISGIGKAVGFAGTAGYIASKGLPMPEALAAIAVAIEIGAAAMIMLGWKARLGALALLVFLIPVTIIFHPFWAVAAEQVQLQRIMFLKNLSIVGAVLYIMAYGSGPFSLDRK
ncbi:MAG TPA: DoxX family protein [Burkholderiales bacterium]|nr:DoxX family protein [Burkholderiales bacterium]